VALSKFDGIRLHLFSHPSLALPQNFVEIVTRAGIEVSVYDDLSELVQKVDILYQTRIQKERLPDLLEYDKAKAISEFTMEMMNKTRKGFGLMHPLPVDKEAPSISSKIDIHPKALYKTQAGNGVPTRLTELALALGLIGEDFSGSSFSITPSDDVFIEELPIKNNPVRTDVSIRPIRDRGVVIDHAAPYMEEILMQVLKIKERRDIYRAATVKSLRRPAYVKGMLMIENRRFTNEELKIIASVSPGCTVNEVENGSVVKKLKLRLPAQIMELPALMCTNKGCISRPEYLESVSPKMVKVTENTVRCHFCDQIMDTTQIV
jgi:aspartate carbamoyltransferase regulatory subunit